MNIPQPELGRKHRKPRSVENWRVHILASNSGKFAHFRILPREIRNSVAYLALSLAEREILHCVLDKQEYESGNHKNKKNVKSPGRPKFNTFQLTTNELKSRGVRSDHVIAQGKKRLWEQGFIDVIRTGTFLIPAEFRYSERWRKFPNGDYKPRDQQPPGKCLYPPKKKPSVSATVSLTVPNTVSNTPLTVCGTVKKGLFDHDLTV